MGNLGTGFYAISETDLEAVLQDESREYWTLPTSIEKFQGIADPSTIKQVAVGQDSCYVLLRDGNLYSWGLDDTALCRQISKTDENFRCVQVLQFHGGATPQIEKVA
jgi:alpha-tubulin suppressor-like RCC1 family protein